MLLHLENGGIHRSLWKQNAQRYVVTNLLLCPFVYYAVMCFKIEIMLPHSQAHSKDQRTSLGMRLEIMLPRAPETLGSMCVCESVCLFHLAFLEQGTSQTNTLCIPTFQVT